MKTDKNTTDNQAQSALSRGFRILHCFSTLEPELSAKDLMLKTGLPKSTLFRILNSLMEIGVLRHSERKEKFTLSPGLIALAAPALTCMPIRQLARPMMQQLADYAQGQVSIAVEANDTLIYAEIAHCIESTFFRPDIGTTLSLSRTASGRVYLNMLSSEKREFLLDRMSGGDQERLEMINSKLKDAATELTQLGFTKNEGELIPNVQSVAIPVRPSLVDNQIFIFGCTISTYQLADKPNFLNEIGMRLSSLVSNVQMALGK